MDVHATFKTLDEANKAAETLLQALKSDVGGDASIERFEREGRQMGTVIHPEDAHFVAVEVKCRYVAALEYPPGLGSPPLE